MSLVIPYPCGSTSVPGLLQSGGPSEPPAPALQALLPPLPRQADSGRARQGGEPHAATWPLTAS